VKGLLHEQWREDWIRRGMWWASEDLPPAIWDPVRQLRSIGYDPCFARPAPNHDRSPDELRGAIAVADLESVAVADLIHENATATALRRTTSRSWSGSFRPGPCATGARP
jgi:hypothetical protein